MHLTINSKKVGLTFFTVLRSKQRTNHSQEVHIEFTLNNKAWMSNQILNCSKFKQSYQRQFKISLNHQHSGAVRFQTNQC